MHARTCTFARTLARVRARVRARAPAPAREEFLLAGTVKHEVYKSALRATWVTTCIQYDHDHDHDHHDDHDDHDHHGASDPIPRGDDPFLTPF